MDGMRKVQVSLSANPTSLDAENASTLEKSRPNKANLTEKIQQSSGLLVLDGILLMLGGHTDILSYTNRSVG